MNKMKVEKGLIYIFLIILTFITIVPIYLLLINSTRSTDQILQGISFIPSTYFIHNWHILTNRGFDIWRGFFNSMFIAFSATALTVYFSALTAYGIKIYNFKGKKFLSSFMMLVIMIPPQLGVIGFYQYMSKLHLTDNYLPLILPAIASPVTVFFIMQYIESAMSIELVEAARIDGAGEFRIFNFIALPVISPALFSMAIFAFVAVWNNFITPFIFISSTDKYTLPMLVQLLRTDIYRTEYGGIYLGIAVSIIPVLIVYSIFAKRIISGISLGGVKE